MNEIEKLFRKIPKQDRISIQYALELLFKRDLISLHCKKLKGYNYIFRIRVKNYRIIYFDDGNEIILKTIKRRDESTYSGL